MYLRWLVFAVLDVFSVVINIPAAPIVALFANREGYLPRLLWWFQTPDNPLDGDGGWISEHWQWRKRLPAPLARYVGRVGWLWRNSMYGFAIDVLGAKTLGTDKLLVVGDLLTSNRPIHSGTVRRYLVRDGRIIYWQLYYVRRWSATRCIRINLGWKLWSFKEGEAINCQFVFSPNPAMGLSEKGESDV
jgi:hypothetical protein